MKNVFLDKGIILPPGAISKDKINLVAGAITQPFAEVLFELMILTETIRFYSREQRVKVMLA